MISLRSALRFTNDRSGVVGLEYGLIAACIVVPLALSLAPLGQALEQVFSHLAAVLAAHGDRVSTVSLGSFARFR